MGKVVQGNHSKVRHHTKMDHNIHCNMIAANTMGHYANGAILKSSHWNNNMDRRKSLKIQQKGHHKHPNYPSKGETTLRPRNNYLLLLADRIVDRFHLSQYYRRNLESAR